MNESKKGKLRGSQSETQSKVIYKCTNNKMVTTLQKYNVNLAESFLVASAKKVANLQLGAHSTLTSFLIL